MMSKTHNAVLMMDFKDGDSIGDSYFSWSVMNTLVSRDNGLKDHVVILLLPEELWVPTKELTSGTGVVFSDTGTSSPQNYKTVALLYQWVSGSFWE